MVVVANIFIPMRALPPMKAACGDSRVHLSQWPTATHRYSVIRAVRNKGLLNCSAPSHATLSHLFTRCAHPLCYSLTLYSPQTRLWLVQSDPTGYLTQLHCHTHALGLEQWMSCATSSRNLSARRGCRTHCRLGFLWCQPRWRSGSQNT